MWWIVAAVLAHRAYWTTGLSYADDDDNDDDDDEGPGPGGPGPSDPTYRPSPSSHPRDDRDDAGGAPLRHRTPESALTTTPTDHHTVVTRQWTGMIDLRVILITLVAGSVAIADGARELHGQDHTHHPVQAMVLGSPIV